MSSRGRQAALVGDLGHLNFARVMAQHPDLYGAFLPFLGKLIPGSDLPPRDREILVIRTLALCEEVYEAHHHVLIADKAGMTTADIDAARTDGPGLTPFGHALARAAEELVRDHRMSDETWAELTRRYSQAQLMEVVFLVGGYALMAMVTNSFGIQVEDDPDTIRRLAELRQYT